MLTQKFVTVSKQRSKKIELGGIVITVRDINGQNGEVVIGQPGLPNLIKKLSLGDAVLYETTSDGMFEIRVIKFIDNDWRTAIKFLITCVSPRLGLMAGLEPNDKMNSPFMDDEVSKIRDGLTDIGDKMAERSDVTPEQLDLLNRKLDDIASASQRLGRKDWIMFVAGNLSNLCVTAAFAPQAATALFKAANATLGWVLQNAIRLIT